MKQLGRGFKAFFLTLADAVIGCLPQRTAAAPAPKAPLCFCYNPHCTLPHIPLAPPGDQPIFEGFEDVPYGTLKSTDDSGAPLPYMITRRIVTEAVYNPAYGGGRKCMCGHPYERHFDGYDENRAVGCKYCTCHHFVEG